MVSQTSCSCCSPPLHTEFLARGPPQLTRTDCSQTAPPKPAALRQPRAHTSLLGRPPRPQPLSLPKRAGRVLPLLVLPLAGAVRARWEERWDTREVRILPDPWKERCYSSPNHTSGTPSAVNLGPIYRSPITYFSSVTVFLGSPKFNCTGHLEGSAP